MLKKGQEEDIEKLPEQWKDLVREVLEKKNEPKDYPEVAQASGNNGRQVPP